MNTILPRKWDTGTNVENETNPKALKFKVCDRIRITKHKNNFSKDYTKNGQKKYLWLIPCEKNDPLTPKIKNWNKEKVTI